MHQLVHHDSRTFGQIHPELRQGLPVADADQLPGAGLRSGVLAVDGELGDALVEELLHAGLVAVDVRELLHHADAQTGQPVGPGERPQVGDAAGQRGALSPVRGEVTLAETGLRDAAEFAEQFAAATGGAAPVVESTGTGGGMQIFCGGVGPNNPDITGASRAIKESEYKECATNGVAEVTEDDVRKSEDDVQKLTDKAIADADAASAAKEKEILGK